jgi:hypothetical protein
VIFNLKTGWNSECILILSSLFEFKIVRFWAEMTASTNFKLTARNAVALAQYADLVGLCSAQEALFLSTLPFWHATAEPYQRQEADHRSDQRAQDQ